MKSIYFQIVFSFLYLFSFSQSTVLKVPDPIDIQSSECIKSSGNSAKQLNCDVGVIDIVTPYSHTLSNTVQPVLVKFKNFGTDTIFPNTMSIRFSYVTYSVQTLYADTLLPNSIDSIQFQNLTISCCINWAGAMTILPSDLDSTNDVFWKRIFPVSLRYAPYFNNFEYNYIEWEDANWASGWENDTLAGNVINSPHSGVNAWKVGWVTGMYPSNYSCYLASPAFDLSSLPSNDTIILSFWNIMNTEVGGDGGLVEYSKNNGMTWHILGTVSDTNATNWYNTTIGGNPCWSGTYNWQEATYKLDPQQFSTSDTVIFRFKFFSNSTNNNFDGWAIDDFKITSKTAVSDIGVVEILLPDTIIIGSNDTINVIIKNFGNVSQHFIDVQGSLNNNIGWGMWYGNLLPGQADTITIYSYMPMFVLPGNSSFCVWTDLFINQWDDQNNLNDTICKSIFVVQLQNDIGVVDNDIFKDPAFPGMNLYKVLVKVENFGTLPQTSFPINFEIPGFVTTFTQTCNKMLMPGSQVIDTFSINFTKPFVNYYVSTWTSLSTDQVTYNDYKWTYWSVHSPVVNEPPINPGSISSISSISSIDPESAKNKILLEQNVPNPTSGITTINFYLPTQGEYIFNVTNIHGQQIYSEVKEQSAGNHSIMLDLSNMVNGIYYFSIIFKGQKITKKMVVTK